MKTNLDMRDKLGLGCAGLAVLLVAGMILYIPTGPQARYIESLRAMKEAQRQLVMSQKVKAEEEARLRSQEALMAKLTARPPSFDFFSYVNRQLQQAKLLNRAKLDNYRTRTSSAKQPMVQLRLDGVGLKELTDFLHQLYSSGNLIAVYKMDRLRPAVNGQGLECDLTLVTLKP